MSKRQNIEDIAIKPREAKKQKQSEEQSEKQSEEQSEKQSEEQSEKEQNREHETSKEQVGESEADEDEADEAEADEAEAEEDEEPTHHEALCALSHLMANLPENICRNCLRDRDGGDPCRCMICVKCSGWRVETEHRTTQEDMVDEEREYYKAVEYFRGSRTRICRCDHDSDDDDTYRAYY
jgi:cobalamin biosynthesis protein CobT